MPKLLLKLAPHFLYIVAIIALLILLQHCGGQVDAANTRAKLADSARAVAEQDYRWELHLNASYQNSMQDQIRKAEKAGKRADSIDRTRRALEREIKQLYALTRQPFDTTVIDSTCCSLANELVTANESHRADDSAKDAAMLMQIDLSVAQVDSLGLLLSRAHARYRFTDSLNRINQRQAKPRGSVHAGVEGNIGPVSNAGMYFMYHTPNGKEYGINAGIMPTGYYIGGKVGFKISLRKKR